jgi:hypothetical protein
MKRTEHPDDSSIIRHTYANFEELRTHLESGPTNRITICMDKHLLRGGTLEKLKRQAAEDNARLGSNDFRTVSRIRTHINFRRDHDGWVIEENGRGEFRIVGYRHDIDESLKSAHMRRSK